MKKPAKQDLRKPTPEILERLSSTVGPSNALTDPDLQKPYLVEWRDRFVGKTPLVLRPTTTNEVAKILEIANAERVGVVPQGGNTGLVGGQIPNQSNSEIIVTTEKLNRVRATDPNDRHIIVEAGLTLANIQSVAEENGRLFPVSLASEGSCQIGGNLATNAGGINVLAYGNVRDLVLGLEVVLPDGRIWNGLRTLKKDNTGYSLKDLFVGSEGTLGIITAAVLKLLPRPKSQTTCMAATKDLETTLALFNQAEASFGTVMTAFEFVSHAALEFVTRHIEGTRSPFTKAHPWYVILEFSSQFDTQAPDAMNEFLQTASNRNLVTDATIATSLKQRSEIWKLREEISAAQKPEGGSIKHDISVPISTIPAFIARANTIIEKMCPGARPVPFGHFGDGNIHYNISQPKSMDRDAFLMLWEPMSKAIHDLVDEFEGSFSAEHGIGQLKCEHLVRYKSTEELQMMRTVKAALDPNGILNPGKLL